MKLLLIVVVISSVFVGSEEVCGLQAPFCLYKAFPPLRKHSHAQHLLEVMAHPHQEMALKINHLRDRELQALESLEKVHHPREKCLEEEVVEEFPVSVSAYWISLLFLCFS